MPLLTVGHGTASTDELTRLLTGAGVELLIDVRSHPGSRRHPHVNRGELERWVPAAGVDYRWESRLGGRRSPAGDTPHLALEVAQFRGYADHMATDGFREALHGVLEEAASRTVAVMCAESVWWRCHRRLLADAAVLLHDAAVRHLFHDGRLAPHEPLAAARVERPADDPHGRLVYDVGENLRLT